jgi:serine/threonine protein kinase
LAQAGRFAAEERHVSTAPPAPVDAADVEQPGDIAGLEVLGEIGHGAQAVVYRVRRGGREYAMKVLRLRGVDDESYALAFRRETALLASIDAPGLARVHDVGVTDGRPYLLMDLIEGQQLSGLLGTGPLPGGRVSALGIDVAEALTAAHRGGLVHRDVKPNNIILTPDGSARLIDFGLAARLDDVCAGQVAGTLAYSSPEQSGMLNRPVDGRSDLYSLGAVLFECATGEPPYSAGDVGELLRLHAVAPVPDPRELAPDLSPALAGIIRRLLAKDPDDRYQSGVGLLADLRRAAAEPDADFPLGTADEPWAAQDGPLVGVDGELATLTARWEQALANRGGIALVHGAPGGGKSRLARELTGSARRSGQLVLHGKSSTDDPQPFAPLRAAIDAYVRSLSGLPDGGSGPAAQQLKAAAGPSASLVKGLSPALATVLAAPDPVGEIGQERYAAAVAAFLTELARLAGGAVLHLDDVQWADEATVRVLEQMASELAGVPMLVIGTARDDAASVPAVEALRARLAGRPSSTVWGRFSRVLRERVSATLSGCWARLPEPVPNARPAGSTAVTGHVATVTQVPVSTERVIASRTAALRTASSSVVPYGVPSATERRK